MKVPSTKWFISAAVLAAVLILAVPSASGGFSTWFVRLADEPNGPAPEVSLDHNRPTLLEEGDDEPQAEYAPFESGRIYLEEESEEPQPESSLRLDKTIFLETEPNGPAPECYPCQL